MISRTTHTHLARRNVFDSSVDCMYDLEHMNNLSGEQRAMLERLARLPDAAVDLSDQPEMLDWSNAERGKFYRPVTQSQSGQTLTAVSRKTRSSSD